MLIKEKKNLAQTSNYNLEERKTIVRNASIEFAHISC